MPLMRHVADRIKYHRRAGHSQRHPPPHREARAAGGIAAYII